MINESFELSKIPYSDFPKHSIKSDMLSKHQGEIRWRGMVNRCLNPDEPAYKNYGGRGIKVCDDWHKLNINGRKNYIDWLTVEMSKLNLSFKDRFDVDRIDNNYHYTPNNCRLVDRSINSQNTRTCKLTRDDVIYLRKKYSEINDNDKFFKLLKEISVEKNIVELTLIKSVTGRSWSNLNHIQPPIDLPERKGGVKSNIADETIIGWRNRIRVLEMKKRYKEMLLIAKESGLHRVSVSRYLKGKLAVHLNEFYPPVYCMEPISKEYIEELKNRYLKEKISLNAFSIKISKETGIPRGTIYDRISKIL